MLDHNHTGGMEALRGETLGDHLVGMYICSIILGQPWGTCPGVCTPGGYGYGLGPRHLGVYPCPSLTLFDDGCRVWVLQHGLHDAQLAITETGQWIDSNQMCPTHCLQEDKITVEVEGEDSLACQQLFGGAGMGGDSIGGVCLDIAEDTDMVNRTRERQWGSARGVWELRPSDRTHAISLPMKLQCFWD